MGVFLSEEPQMLHANFLFYSVSIYAILAWGLGESISHTWLSALHENMSNNVVSLDFEEQNVIKDRIQS